MASGVNAMAASRTSAGTLGLPPGFRACPGCTGLRLCPREQRAMRRLLEPSARSDWRRSITRVSGTTPRCRTRSSLRRRAMRSTGPTPSDDWAHRLHTAASALRPRMRPNYSTWFNRRASAARRLLLLALKQGAWQSEGPRRTMRGAPLHVQRHGWARTTMSWLGRLFGQSAGRRKLAARVEDNLSHLEDQSDVGTVPNLLRRELVIINCAESSLGKFIRKPDHPV